MYKSMYFIMKKQFILCLNSLRFSIFSSLFYYKTMQFILCYFQKYIYIIMDFLFENRNKLTTNVYKKLCLNCILTISININFNKYA